MHLINIINKLCVVLIINTSILECQKIETEHGWLSGKEEKSQNGRPYFAFRGIPFAQPPVDELRFEPPRPFTTKWEGEREAIEHVPFCAQAALGYNEGQEDCLYLAVYSPKIESEAKLPVLVWLHGGAFVTGGAAEYNPYLMMDRNVVLVIPQYRLGMLGFYTLYSVFAAGNYGLLDQLEALRWVNKNIAKFGGDPNRVTLGGDCAGGVSAVLHMMAPLSHGLFERVISLSGSPLSYWALAERHNRLGLLVSKHILCPAYDHQVMMKCFRERSASELLETQMHVLEVRDLLVGNHKLAPAVQFPAYSHESTLFLDDYPLTKLLKGEYAKLPALISVTRDVGSYLVDIALYEFLANYTKDDPEFLLKNLLPMLLPQLGFRYNEEHDKKFTEFYFSNWDFKDLEKAIPGLTSMLGDALFNAPIISMAKLLSKTTETRLLRFDYENGPKLFDYRHPGGDSSLKPPPIELTRVSHGDEMFFVFPFVEFDMTPEYKRISSKMLDMIEDFVYGRNSLKSWPLFTSEGLETRVLTAQGEIEPSIKFVDKRTEEFFHYIAQNQQYRALQSIEENGEIDIKKWKHDEL